MKPNPELLADRYGARKPANQKRFKVLAILGVAAMTVTAMWFGFANYSPISHQDISFRVMSELEIEVEFELSKPTDATVVCSLEALNNAFATVGYVELEFGPSEVTTNRHTVRILTTELAVTGLVDQCQLR